MAPALKKLKGSLKTRWNELEGRQYVSTKFFDSATLRALDCYECVAQMLSRGGLAGFLEKRAPSFEGLTQDFLASLTKVERGYQFHLCDQIFVVDEHDLREILGVSMGPTKDWKTDMRDDGVYQFWTDITRTNFDTAHGEPGSAIPHPAIRLCHKVLAMCFMGNAEVTKLTRYELEAIWCLMPGRDIIPDWIAMFLASCSHYPRRRGKVGFGGMVTVIALAFMDMDRIRAYHGPPVPGGWIYDMRTLRTASCVRPMANDPDQMCWLVRSRPYFRLPKPLPYAESAAEFYLPPDKDGAPAPPAPAPMRVDEAPDPVPAPPIYGAYAGSSSYGAGTSSQAAAEASYGPPYSIDSLGQMMQQMMSTQRSHHDETMTRFESIGTRLDEVERHVYELQDRQSHYQGFYQAHHQAESSFWMGQYPDYPAWPDYQHPPPPPPPEQ